MKVLHVTNNFPTKKYPIFGIFVKEQINSLNQIGIENKVFFINGREKGKKEYFIQIFKLRKHLSKYKYDIIHCHHALSSIILFLTGYKKKNVIVSFQNDPNNELGNFIFRWVQKRSTLNIFKNNNQLINSKNNFYLPNGVNINFFKPIPKKQACNKLGMDCSKIYILFVSSNFMRKQKRYDRFKKVLGLLQEYYVKNQIKEIVLLNTSRELIPYYYNIADVHLLTSDYEGSPNSVKECMACNTSVVSTNVGNVKELLLGTNDSFVAERFDVEELAKLVIKAIDLKDKNGRDRIVHLGLDIESVAIKLLNIYKKIPQR